MSCKSGTISLENTSRKRIRYFYWKNPTVFITIFITSCKKVIRIVKIPWDIFFRDRYLTNNIWHLTNKISAFILTFKKLRRVCPLHNDVQTRWRTWYCFHKQTQSLLTGLRLSLATCSRRILTSDAPSLGLAGLLLFALRKNIINIGIGVSNNSWQITANYTFTVISCLG